MRFLDELKIYYKSEQSFQKVIIWNIVIALVFFILKAYYSVGYNFVLNWFSLSGTGFQSFLKPWTYVTYAFLHANFFHLLSNIIMLYFACRLFYTYFSDKQFLTVYFLGIIFSGIIYIISSIIFNNPSVLVGASAGVLAVLFTVVTYNPYGDIQLLLIGKVRLWVIGAFLILFFLIQIPTSNFGGHIAHFGGVFFGWFYATLLSRGYDISKFIFKSSTSKKAKNKTPFKKVYYNNNVKQTLQNSEHLATKKRIDDILDKISSSGYDSLTTDEKQFLFKAGKD